MRSLVLVLSLTSLCAGASPVESALTRDAGTWVKRLVHRPRRTALEVAEYFVRVPADEWDEVFASELYLFTLLGARVATGAGAPSPTRTRDAFARVGLGERRDLADRALSFARTFLRAAHAEPAPAWPALVEWLLKSDDTFWPELVIERYLEKDGPEAKDYLAILPHVPPRLFARAARAVAANQYDTRDALGPMNILVLAQALRRAPLELGISNDPRADRHCARLLADALTLIEGPRLTKQSVLTGQDLVQPRTRRGPVLRSPEEFGEGRE